MNDTSLLSADSDNDHSCHSQVSLFQRHCQLKRQSHVTCTPLIHGLRSGNTWPHSGSSQLQWWNNNFWKCSWTICSGDYCHRHFTDTHTDHFPDFVTRAISPQKLRHKHIDWAQAFQNTTGFLTILRCVWLFNISLFCADPDFHSELVHNTQFIQSAITNNTTQSMQTVADCYKHGRRSQGGQGDVPHLKKFFCMKLLLILESRCMNF